jgi:hypothetical protein
MDARCAALLQCSHLPILVLCQTTKVWRGFGRRIRQVRPAPISNHQGKRPISPFSLSSSSMRIPLTNHTLIPDSSVGWIFHFLDRRTVASRSNDLRISRGVPNTSLVLLGRREENGMNQRTNTGWLTDARGRTTPPRR